LEFDCMLYLALNCAADSSLSGASPPRRYRFRSSLADMSLSAIVSFTVGERGNGGRVQLRDVSGAGASPTSPHRPHRASRLRCVARKVLQQRAWRVVTRRWRQ